MGTTLRIVLAGGELPFPSYSWQFFLLPLFGALGLFTLVFT